MRGDTPGTPAQHLPDSHSSTEEVNGKVRRSDG
jgi:hypothetical protein